MDIKALSEQIEPYIINRRRYYHQYPELSGEEIETTRSIQKDLQDMGLVPELFTDCHGLTCLIKGEKPGRTVALRADIDALNIMEKTGLSFASENGLMHACGHDAHIAMALGAAKILAANQTELKGNVKLIFQAEEEAGLGSHKCIAEGALDGVDAIYGAHIWGNFDAPLIDVSPGKRMAANNSFVIRIKGCSAHAGASFLGVDAISAAASVIMNLQMLSSRWNNPLDPITLTIGTINGGNAYNILADEVKLTGSVRHFRNDKSIEEEMRHIISNTCEALHAGYEMEYLYLTQPVINDDEELNRIAQAAVIKLYGEAGLGQLPVMLSSEDYSAYMVKIPAIFAFIGTRNTSKGLTYTNHHASFSIDEDVLKRGTALMAQFAIDYLGAG